MNGIAEIKEFSIEKKVADHFKDSPDLRNEKIGEFSAINFSSLLDRAIKQLEAELDTDSFHFLPAVNVIIGQQNTKYNLIQGVQSIKNFLNADQIQNLPSHLINLVQYQQTFGFWRRSESMVHDADSLSVKKKEKELNILVEEVKNQLEIVKKTRKEITQKKQEYQKFIDSKKGEITEIGNLLNQTRESANTINSLLQNSQNHKGKIEEINSTQGKLLDDTRKRIQEEQQKFESFQKDLHNLKKLLEENVAHSEHRFQELKEAFEFIQSKEEDIIRLTGFAADGALGNKFRLREDSIHRNLGKWIGGIIFTTIFAIGWTLIVFKWLLTSTNILWLDLIINIIKTAPAYILLGFVIKQYTKERNLQEEYAYRAAVAMTITAYSDMLKDSDKAENASRQQMLLGAIDKIFNSPRIYREQSDRILSFSTRDLKESIKELTSTVKELKDDVLNK